MPDATKRDDAVPPAVRDLARTVERALRKLQTLDEQVGQLTDQITAVYGTHDAPVPTADAEPGVAEPGVRSWLLADDPAQAAADLDDLAAWVWRVYLWFPDGWLSSCWLWHPEVIEELWWLRVAHAEAFDAKTGSSTRAGDWHERQRPGVARRVRAVLAKCELSRHAPVGGRGIDVTPPGPPALARHAGAVALVWAAGAELEAVRAAGPEPTPEQLTEADAYQRALYRSQR
jgi:hypothetical protein